MILGELTLASPMSNHQDFHSQCVHFLDCVEKTAFFNLFTALKSSGASLLNDMVNKADEIINHYPEHTWISQVLSDKHVIGIYCHLMPSLFHKEHSYVANNAITILLNGCPHISNASIKDIATQFNLPDLHPAFRDYFSGQSYEACGHA